MTIYDLIKKTPRLSSLQNFPEKCWEEMRKPTEKMLKPNSFLQDRTLDFLLGIWKSGLILNGIELIANNDPSVAPVINGVADAQSVPAIAIVCGFKRIYQNLTVRDGVDMGVQSSQDMIDQLSIIIRGMGIPFSDEDVESIKDYGKVLCGIDEKELGYIVSREDVFKALVNNPIWVLADDPIVECVFVEDRWHLRIKITDGLHEAVEVIGIMGIEKPSSDVQLNEAHAVLERMNRTY